MTTKIHKFCSTRRKVVETDYSKWDGTVSKYLRHVERVVLEQSFDPKYRGELRKLIDRDQNLKGVTRYKVRYETNSSRLSGSQLTTIGNTVLNAFVAFCALRRANFSSNAAFENIGPKFGDDGIDDARGMYVDVAKDLGIKVKIINRSTNDHVAFCGRLYVKPHTHCCSIFNPVKALQSLPVGLNNKTHEDKVAGYLATDANTPLLAHYARAIQRARGYVASGDVFDDVTGWKATPYPWDPALEDFVHSLIGRLLNEDPQQIRSVCARLDGCVTVEDLKQLGCNDCLKLSITPEPAVRFVEEERRVGVRKEPFNEQI
jgi:hypothetical protein